LQAAKAPEGERKMLRDYGAELEKRVAFIRGLLEESRSSGIVFGNSGGKDSALVGILCKKACDNTVGIMLPCEAKRNFEEDMSDAIEAARSFGIETRVIDVTPVKQALVGAIGDKTSLNSAALVNMAPRIRMTTLYAIAASERRLVAGTGNRSEIYMGYFTKYGDGGHDFDPIADLTVTEIYEFLEYLKAPESIIKKAPSAGLFEGQTDEAEMGVTYEAIDRFLFTGEANDHDRAIIERYHAGSEHKRRMPKKYKEIEE